jgi:cytoskeletal protein CcmA (bactofilin family)
MLPQFRKPENDSPQPSLSNVSTPTALGPRPSGPSFRSGGPSGSSVIGADLVIHGNLTSKGEIQVEGEVQGDIYGTHVIIGERARVTGSVVAEECVIRGHLLGTVRARRVMLQSSSHFEGDIFHQTMAIEQGAFFEGKSRRTDDPLAGVGKPERTIESAAPAPSSSEPIPFKPELPGSLG